MTSDSYLQRRVALKTYFDRTAVEAWARLTSDVPVSGIRATVRAGRDRMRTTLLDWLPDDLQGCSLLDAGCGTGALAVEAAQRGATVTAVDLSPKLVELARERAPHISSGGSIRFKVGDFLDPNLGHFDHVVAMDSLIHYRLPDVVAALHLLSTRTRRSVSFTFAPRTSLLAIMHTVGRCFPRADRAPSIEPFAEASLRSQLDLEPGLKDWRVARSHRVVNGFYTSQAVELVRG